MTRIQGERFSDRKEYERLRDVYVLNKAKLERAKPDLSIMHPLPRVNEIDIDVDDDPRANYFEQAANGRYIRMALILELLKKSKDDGRVSLGEEDPALICKNPHCISGSERGIKHLYRNGSCIYCDQKAKKI
jgi:aspartate carbamoyltransferase catalytic subunit